MQPSAPPLPAAAPRRVPPAIFFLILMIPFGASGGYLIVNLEYQLASHGLSTAAIAGVVAVSYIPHTWRFLWAPLVDTVWTRKRWYVAGTLLCGLGLWQAGRITGEATPSLVMLGAMQLVYNVGATLLAMAVESLMAAIVPDDQRGRTSGWFQAGNLGGQGIGGGLSLWLVQAQGWSVGDSGAALAFIFALCSVPIFLLPDPKPVVIVGDRVAESTHLGVAATLKAIASDLWRLVRSRAGALALVICFLPIGSGAAQNLWAAIAGDWHASAGVVALVNGAMGGVISAIGCVAGGWICDRVDRKTTYCAFGAALAACAVAMAISARTPAQFVVWTSVYAFILGLSYTAFSAVVFEAIGRTAAATKYSLLAALSNMPIQYMTLVDGYANDGWGTRGLLYADAGCGALGIAVFLVLAGVTKRAKVASLAAGEGAAAS